MCLMRRVEFYRRIVNNENTLEYVVELGLLSFVRPHCYATGCNGLMNFEKRKVGTLSMQDGVQQVCVPKDQKLICQSIFHDSKMFISSMLEAIYFYCELGRIEHKASQLGVTKKILGLLYEKIGGKSLF
ncbi:hypothetical protein ENBRE01_2994 [Enteropsectra breve]|nr:hypothetical protein ENBRE01_2994 [Enteropsectra breve]